MELYDMDLNNLESSNLIASLPEEKKQVYIKVIIQYLNDEGYKRYED